MNKKGQALVEFIIILPVFIFMILAIIDIGKMLYDKSAMQSKLNDAVQMYENGKKYDDIKEYITKSDPAYKLELKNENNDYIIRKFTLENSVGLQSNDSGSTKIVLTLPKALTEFVVKLGDNRNNMASFRVS